MNENSDQNLAPRFAVIQGLAEISLGSLVHALKIPLGGQVLSLNQGVILTFAVRRAGPVRESSRDLAVAPLVQVSRPVEFSHGRKTAVTLANHVSCLAACLKTLSPIGNRLTPMLAIAVQGFLFSLGIAIFGVNSLGVMAGMGLLSVWSFVQPLLLAYLIFGGSLFEAVFKLWNGIVNELHLDPALGPALLFSLVIFKILVAAGLGFYFFRTSETGEKEYFKKVNGVTGRISKSRGFRSASAESALVPRGTRFLQALKDLWNPWFLLSFVLSAGFVALSPGSTSFSVFVYSLRIIGSGFLVFFLFRELPRHIDRKRLERFPGLAKALEAMREKEVS